MFCGPAVRLHGIFFLFVVIWLVHHPASGAAAQNSKGFLEPIVKGLKFPLVNIISPRDGSGRTFVLEMHSGRIRVIKDKKLLADDFLDIGDRLPDNPDSEAGLFGLAFPPGFPSKKHVYVSYLGRNGSLVLSRFRVTEDTSKAIEASEEKIFSQPAGFHHCGHIAFSPLDKLLYLCIGDPGYQKQAQQLSGYFGKILRFDVETTQKPYSAPPNHPFVAAKGALPEIWAYGFRNPWRFTFDSLTGDMFIPDVGDFSWEEINFQPAGSSGGENYGWSIAEGNYLSLRTEGSELADILEFATPPVWHRTDFDRSKLTWPIFEYRHGPDGCAVIGGAVYRGTKFPNWNGTYLFSDFCSGRISALRRVKGEWLYRLIAKTSADQPTVLGTGSDGEILVAHYGDGGIYRLSFPENFVDGWVPAELLMLKRRVEQLETYIEALRNSRSWRWTKPLRTIVRRIRDLFAPAQ